MNSPTTPNPELELRLSRRLLDVLIRYGLVLVLVLLCYRIFAPFISLMAWALILAVTLYPLQQLVAKKVKGRQGLAAAIIAVAAIGMIVMPTAVLVVSLGDSVQATVHNLQEKPLVVPPPRPGVETWPIVGKHVYAVWMKAHTDLPDLIVSKRPQIVGLAKKAMAAVASIGVGLLMFIAAFGVAGIIMAYGEEGKLRSVDIFNRIVGPARGPGFVALSTSTIRAVAQGVVGVAFIQGLLVGIILLVAGVPWAGVIAAITVVVAIAQIPVLIITLPAIGYIWSSGDYATLPAVLYTVLLMVAGLIDNVLKPLMLGRGVEAPMPVILLGALGGMATAGILGMFEGAVLLALGYQIFMHWVDTNPDIATATPESKPEVDNG